jgi:hypothetical protein
MLTLERASVPAFEQGETPMTIPMLRASLIVQGATAKPTTTTQNQRTDQDLQTAARDLREAIRNNINAEAIKARAQAAAAQAEAAQAATQKTPTGPFGPRQITVQGPDGQTVIGVPPPFGNNDIPPQAVDLAFGFFFTIAVIIIGLPLARAFARRMDRRSGPAQIPTEISTQLAQLNQAVDAIALEVERISEGQRFTARLLSEQRDAGRQTLSSGADR